MTDHKASSKASSKAVSEISSKEAPIQTGSTISLKNNFNGYRFCPRCASKFARKDIDGHTRLVCSSSECGFIFYHNPIPGAGVIIYTELGMLLVKRAHAPRIGSWCLPAGFMEWDESPKRTAIRETAEETGLIIEIDSLFDVYSGDDDPRINAVLTLYEAHIVGGKLQAGDDAMEAEFFQLNDIPKDIAFLAHSDAINELRQRVESGKLIASKSGI